MPLDTLEREILQRIERKVDNLDKEWKDAWREASEKYHEFVVETIKTEGRLTSDISGIRGQQRIVYWMLGTLAATSLTALAGWIATHIG